MNGIEIRKMVLNDRAEVELVLSRCFGGLNPAGIVERELALGPETCWVAVTDLAVVGLVCAVQYDQLSYIGPMAVAPELQGNGIGYLLFEGLVKTLESRGCTTMMLDATNAGEPLYRKFGFAEWARTFDMGRTAGAGISTVPGNQDLAAVVSMDRALFTADREAMLRRLLEHEGAALYANPTAYLVTQTRVLGPFAAFDPTSAARLLDHALDDGAVASRALAPVENPEAVGLLAKRGFQVQREVKHLRRGKPIAMRRDLMYGLASFALG